MSTAIPNEFEAAFIDIDKNALRQKLISLGAVLKQPEVLMRRINFDTGKRSFVRVRDEGDRVTMSYKRIEEHSLTGVKEVCLAVDDYAQAIIFLKSIGLRPKAEQETYREAWTLPGVEIDIDTWPWIPSFAEIEGANPEIVKSTAKDLGFDMKNSIFGGTDEIYKIYYDVTSDDINYLPEIKFTKIPDWLEQKRR